MDLEDLQACLRVGHADFNLTVETPWPSQCWIQDLGNIRRTDDDDLTARDEAVHEAQELRDDALLDLAGHFSTLRCDCVDLVDEQNRRRPARRFLEDLAEFGLALAVELPHDLRAV